MASRKQLLLLYTGLAFVLLIVHTFLRSQRGNKVLRWGESRHPPQSPSKIGGIDGEGQVTVIGDSGSHGNVNAGKHPPGSQLLSVAEKGGVVVTERSSAALTIKEKVATLKQDGDTEASPHVDIAPDAVNLSLQDKVAALKRGKAVRTHLREEVRLRSFKMMSSNDVPWAGKIVKSQVLGPAYIQKSVEACNPVSMACQCLAEWYKRDVCVEVGHRQKPQVRMVFYEKAWWQPNSVDIGWHDCPTTRCEVALGTAHKPDSHAFISPLQPGRFFPSIFFPPKVSSLVNKNVMLNFESAVKYRILSNQSFYRAHDINVYGSHTGEPVPKALTEAGLLSFLDLSDLDRPAQSFRVPGPSFAERGDDLALFVSHCKGTRQRSILLEQIARVSSVISFGECSPQAAKFAQGQVDKYYPKCAGMDMVGRMAEKECVLKHSKFALAIENVQESGYITEKLYQALVMGAVPIYWGALDIRDLLPHPDAAILLDDYATPAQCMEYVKKVGADENLWRKHTAWKSQNFSAGFNRILKNQRGSMFCRICEHLGDRMAPPDMSLVDTLSECAFNTLSRLSAEIDLPPGDPYKYLGVDAAMWIGQEEAGRQQRRAMTWVPLAQVPAATHTWASADEVQCAADVINADAVIAADKGLDDGQQLGMRFQLAVALFRIAQDGRQNALIVGSSNSGSSNSAGGGEALWGAGRDAPKQWNNIMRHLPADYDVLVLSPSALHGKDGEPLLQGKDQSVVHLVSEKPPPAGDWLVSYKGALSLLHGTTSAELKIYRAAA